MFAPLLGQEPPAERSDLAHVDHRNCGEVECGHVFARRQLGLLEVTLDAPLIALGELVLEQSGEIAGCWPAFAVGALGELRPQPTDGRYTQRGQQCRQADQIDGDSSSRRRSACGLRRRLGRTCR
jgi:hypothetical protein